MTSRERVFRQARGEEVDHVPLMGGWFHGVRNLAKLAGLSPDEYLRDPAASLIRANRALGIDCMVDPIVPTELDQVRTAETLESAFENVEPEDIVAVVERIPQSAAEVLAAFDAAAEEERLRAHLEGRRALFGDIVVVPNFWEAVPDFHLYSVYGYRSYFEAMALYPEAVGRIFWRDAVLARARNGIVARLIEELGLPPLMFTGGDICNNRGPMCSIAFLREQYFPHERYAMEPLVEAGIRVVRHCDGDVTTLVEDFLDVGYSGFQGFQHECGVDLASLTRLRSRRGARLLFFTGMNVTRTLPFGTPDEVRAEVDRAFAATDGGRGLFLFTSSSIGPEVPLENVVAGYRRAAELPMPARRRSR